MDTAKILTTINYKDFTPIDMIYIIEELSDIHGRENIKTTLKSILDFMERWEREQQFSFFIRARAHSCTDFNTKKIEKDVDKFLYINYNIDR